MSSKEDKNKKMAKKKETNIIQDALNTALELNPVILEENDMPELILTNKDCAPDPKNKNKRPRCKTGQRCDTDSKSSTFNQCITKKEIRIQDTTLKVVERTKKDYGYGLISVLEKYPAQIKELIKTKDNELKKKIKDLEEKITSKKSNFRAKYGDLKDELIIQVILLTNHLNDLNEKNKSKEKVSPEPAPEPEPEIEYTEEELKENEEISAEIEEEMEEEKEEEKPSPDNEYPDDEFPDLDIEMTDAQKELQENIGVEPNAESKDYNSFLFEKEKTENKYLQENELSDNLYPLLDDPKFNIKIASHQEFNESKFNGEIKDVKETAEEFCNKEFELMPHQQFVKNFLSFETPYNSLLLYHGLGSGKTCSAIGIAEEMRNYMKQVKVNQRILVIASPNVQSNFRLQLFDDRKLKLENGIWNLNTCVGNSLLKEINPSMTLNLTRDKVISQINQIINQYYIFMGYRELGNFIKKKIQVSDELGNVNQQKQMETLKIKKYFNNRLMIIDEIHNLRILQDNKESKKTASLLMYVCEKATNMRLLMLSATPMYNSYKEIIWLTNLLNVVDKRAVIKEDQIFDKDGEFKEGSPENNIEAGQDLLARKLTGYVSFVRGENPYSFPFRVYPDEFEPSKTLDVNSYFRIQLNDKEIDEPIKNLPVYMNKIGSYQKRIYDKIIENFQTKSDTLPLSDSAKNMPTFENMESFGYTLLKEPLESLNIVFPNMEFDALKEDELVNPNLISSMVGKSGLSNIMTYETEYKPNEIRFNYEYKPEIEENYGKIFELSNLEKYSSKIFEICNIVKKSKGPIIIYSFYIDGGVVPLALALEEMGFSRYGSAAFTRSLLKNKNPDPLDAKTMKPKSELLKENPEAKFKQAKYVMITGDKKYSPDNLQDIKYVTDVNNKDGEDVKVILITKAAAEGLDFKFIRQVHILDPWYNLNRLEQIIGRAVRNLSHCALPFEERNVEIYLHGSTMEDDKEKEPADMYVYRFAEKKSKQIGKVSRLLKETSVDCLLNIEQTNFTVDNIAELATNKDIEINLASNKTIVFKMGDKPFSSVCDYMEDCSYKCRPSKEITNDDILKNNYSSNFAKMNYAAIVKRIRQLFREQSFYKNEELIKLINIKTVYPLEHIYFALSLLIENKQDNIVDKHDRNGYLINKGSYYAFQPKEINDENLSIYERSVPLDFKQEKLIMEIEDKPEEEDEEKEDINIDEIDYSVAAEDSKEKIEKEIINKTVLHFESILKDIQSKFDTIEIQKAKYLKIIEFTQRKQELEGNLLNLSRQEKAELAKLKKELVFTRNANKKVETDSDDLALVTGEKDWYIHFGRIYYMLKNNHFVNEETLQQMVLEHYLETISFEDKIFLLRFIYSNYEKPDSIYVKHIQEYIEKRIIDNSIQQGYLVSKKGEPFLFVKKYDDSAWAQAEDLDIKTFEKEIVDKFKVDKSQLANLIGFLDYDNREKEIVFKLKQMNLKTKNNKGAKISVLAKSEILKKINQLLEEYPYLEYKDYKKSYSQDEINDTTKIGLGILFECLIRFYNYNHEIKEGYFLDEETALISDIKTK